ncbi:hypothetical protein AAVH_21151 [Aphelenchoides avenae]|nr:hypothetical protein AAVH_21151 [Aphelenchus avenae]
MNNSLKAIIDYFENRGAADNRRRPESLEACLTLEKLRDVLLDEYGLDLKRSTLYTRLLPRNAITAEGKRHHDCAPVKLLRPQNNLMKKHADGHFASATIRHMTDECLGFTM